MSPHPSTQEGVALEGRCPICGGKLVLVRTAQTTPRPPLDGTCEQCGWKIGDTMLLQAPIVVSPLGGGADDGPRLIGIANANARALAGEIQAVRSAIARGLRARAAKLAPHLERKEEEKRQRTIQEMLLCLASDIEAGTLEQEGGGR